MNINIKCPQSGHVFEYDVEYAISRKLEAHYKVMYVKKISKLKEKMNALIKEVKDTKLKLQLEDYLYLLKTDDIIISYSEEAMINEFINEFVNESDQLSSKVFKLDKVEMIKFKNWRKSLSKIPVDVFGELFQFTFKFHPTGLGVVKTIERDLDGEKIDLTDYNDW